jgi:hypothetical protein
VARKPYDPLAFVPEPQVVREHLAETLTLAERLKMLLDLAERVHMPLTVASTLPTPGGREAVARG